MVPSPLYINQVDLYFVVLKTYSFLKTKTYIPIYFPFWPTRASCNTSLLHVTFRCAGEDGASQMALEDLAMFRTIPGATVFYPSDAVSCERAVELAANTKGVCFIRTSRPNTAILYSGDEEFRISKAKVRVEYLQNWILQISQRCLSAVLLSGD